MNKEYKKIYNYALGLGFKIEYIKKSHNGNFFNFKISKFEYRYSISNYTLEDIKIDIENIYSNLDKDIIKKTTELKSDLKKLLKEYRINFDNTIKTNKEFLNLKSFVLKDYDFELISLEFLKNLLAKFDYYSCFSDDFGTFMYGESKLQEIKILIELLKPRYKDVIQDFINLYNVNEYGHKISV